MTLRSLRRFLACMPLLGVGVVACGSGDAAPPQPTVPADLVVTARNLHWDRDAYQVTPKDGVAVVSLVNDDSMLHNMYFRSADGTTLPEHLEAGPSHAATATVKLAAGTYTIICKVPGHEAMKATLTVTG